MPEITTQKYTTPSDETKTFRAMDTGEQVSTWTVLFAYSRMKFACRMNGLKIFALLSYMASWTNYHQTA